MFFLQFATSILLILKMIHECRIKKFSLIQPIYNFQILNRVGFPQRRKNCDFPQQSKKLWFRVFFAYLFNPTLTNHGGEGDSAGNLIKAEIEEAGKDRKFLRAVTSCQTNSSVFAEFVRMII